MSTKKQFTPEEIRHLRANPYTRCVTADTISYTLAFKEAFWALSLQGYTGPAAFRKLIPLYNRTEHRLGCVLAGTENLHKEIARGVRNNTKGYDEIDSRLGRSYIELPGATEQDVKEICTANGLDDATADRIWNEVDKIKRYVKVTNKRGETKEKNLFFCEDLRRLMRLVKREQIANQFGQM